VTPGGRLDELTIEGPSSDVGELPRTGAPRRFVVGWGAATSVAVYAIVAVACYWPLWWRGPSTHTILGGDQFETTWYLAWVPYALVHGHDPFFSNFQNYPYGVNLLANTSCTLLGLLATPITLLFGATASYATLLTLAMVTSATSVYFVARHFTTWRPAAFAAGLLYGFSPYVIAQGEGHLHLTFIPLPPLILFVLYRLMTGGFARPNRAGVVLGLLVTAQFFISSEILADTAVIAGLGILIGAAVSWRRLHAIAARVAVPSAVAIGVAGTLLAYPVWFAFRGPQHIVGPVQLAGQAYRADAFGPIVPDVFQWLAPSALASVGDHFANNVVENGSYLGVPLLVVLLVAVVVMRRPSVVRLLAALGTGAFVLSLGSSLAIHRPPGSTRLGLPLPEGLLAKIPLLANIAPVRFSLFCDLFAALLLAMFLDQLHGSLRVRTGRASYAVLGPALVAVVAFLPLVPALPYPNTGTITVPAGFTSAAASVLRGSPALVYPYPTYAAPYAVVWQADSFMPVRLPGGIGLVPDARGRLAFSPSTGDFDRSTVVGTVLTDLYRGQPQPLTPGLRAQVLAELRRWQIRIVIAFPALGLRPAADYSYLVSLFGRPGSPSQGAVTWRPPFLPRRADASP
jgi:hypothetical protein